MNRGELLTKLSVWLALVAYTVGTGLWLEARGCVRRMAGARWAWSVGCGFFLVHVACAFSYFHQWSHEAAYRETARQTAELTGWQWGGGLFINYVFAAVWVAMVLRWWFAPASAIDRASRWDAIWHGFFFSMMLNGGVIFVHGPMRWVGILFCGGLALLWFRHWRATQRPITNPQS